MFSRAGRHPLQDDQEERAYNTHTKAQERPRKPAAFSIHRRLAHILEKRKLIPEQQYGFRCGRSTIDVLNILQSKISKSLLEKKHLALVSLDLSKAYDTWLKDRQIDG
jgi:hypothetical protein